MPELFIIKICFTNKVNAVCGGGQLLVSGSRVSGFHVPGFKGRKSQVPGSQSPMSQDPRSQGSRALGPGSVVLILGYAYFNLLLNVYVFSRPCFNNVQINRWLYLSNGSWGILLRYDLFWKRIDPKIFLFIGANNWTVSAVWWSVKYIFTLNFPIFRIRLAEKRAEEEEHGQLQSVMRFTQMQSLHVMNKYV